MDGEARLDRQRYRELGYLYLFHLLDAPERSAVDREERAFQEGGEAELRARGIARLPDVLISEGRQWHGSRNVTSRPRTALLLQYSSAQADIKIPLTFDEPPAWHAVPPLRLVIPVPS
jgi:hypothetical protein